MGIELSNITPSTGFIIFDQITSDIMNMPKTLNELDKVISELLLNDLLPITILAVDAAYVSKGYIPV